MQLWFEGINYRLSLINWELICYFVTFLECMTIWKCKRGGRSSIQVAIGSSSRLTLYFTQHYDGHISVISHMVGSRATTLFITFGQWLRFELRTYKELLAYLVRYRRSLWSWNENRVAVRRSTRFYHSQLSKFFNSKWTAIMSKLKLFPKAFCWFDL